MMSGFPWPGGPGTWAGQRPHRRGLASAGLLGVLGLAAAGLTACGGSGGRAPLAVSCAGHTLPGPDTSEVGQNDSALPPSVTAVAGVPRQSGSVPVSAFSVADPADPARGYVDSRTSYQVKMVSSSGSGQTLWSAGLTVPRSLPRHNPPGVTGPAYPDLFLIAHQGYAVVGGGPQEDYISSVSSSGRAGPACVLPRYVANEAHVELLPHAGLVVLANPAKDEASTGEGDDYRLDAYSTATSKRVWSLATGASVSGQTPDFFISGDTVYLWLAGSGQAAAYDLRTGKNLWTASFANQAVSAPDNGLIADSGGQVYAMVSIADSIKYSRVVALNAATGAQKWQRKVPLASGPSDVAITAVGSGQVLLGDTDNGEEYLLDASSGEQLASAQVGTKAAGENDQMGLCHPAGQPAIAIPGNGAIYVLGPDSADDRTIPAAAGANVVITDTEAYVVASQAGAPVSGYSLATGKLLWTVPVPASIGTDAALYAFNGGFVVDDNTPGGTGLTFR